MIPVYGFVYVCNTELKSFNLILTLHLKSTFRWRFFYESFLRLQQLIEAVVSNLEDKTPVNHTVTRF